MGNYYNYSGAHAYFYSSNLSLEGSNSTFTEEDFGLSFLNGLVINKNAGSYVTLNNSVRVKENVHIISGSLHPQSNTIEVYGSWTNDVGTGGFLESTGRVIFKGSNQSTCNSETFNHLELNKTVMPLQISSGIIVCNQYDWTAGELSVGNATFRALDLADSGIYGKITLSGGIIEYHQDTSQYVDLNAEVSISSGTFTIYGGSDDCFFAFGGAATLTMSGGVLDFASVGIAVGSTANITCNLTGGNIRTVGALAIYKTGLNLAGGTVELYGSSDVSLNCVLSSSVFNLIVNKTSGTRVSEPNPLFSRQPAIRSSAEAMTRTNQTSLGAALIANGTVTVQSGTLNTNHFSLRSIGNCTVNSGGKLALNSNSRLEMGSNASLTVNTGGVLESIGVSGGQVIITHYQGYYACNLESGSTLKAVYTVFEYTNLYGVNIKIGATVDPVYSLTNCIFQNGISAGTLLTVNNSQTLYLNNCYFPTNTWSGNYNVKKSISQGSVTLDSYTGGFSGATYESDYYYRIFWNTETDLQIIAFSYTNVQPYVCDLVNVTVTVKNSGAVNITTPFNVDLYYSRTTPPYPGVYGNKYLNIASLAAGATATVTFTNISTDVAAIWSSYAQVDADSYVTEDNEGNNVSALVSVNWRALPAVSNPAIHYLTNPARIQLNWNYPLSVYRYKIYKDTNPLGSFTTLAGTSTTTGFSETSTLPKCFYRIRAERLLP